MALRIINLIYANKWSTSKKAKFDVKYYKADVFTENSKMVKMVKMIKRVKSLFIKASTFCRQFS